MKKLEDYVISIPDFPSPGIIFRDVTSILQDGEGLHLAIDQLLEMVKDVDFDVIVGAESRGFIFGMPVAYELYKPFILARKPGKLPRETVSMDYALEYGTGTIEMHADSIKPGQKVVIIDDLIATGGTTEAIRSSTITTFWPGRMASLWISISAVPYSSSYSAEMVSQGSFPFLRTGTKLLCSA